jgi:hypothetical protein
MNRGLRACAGIRLGLALLLVLPGVTVSSEFTGTQVPPPNDRLHVQTERNLRVTTAVPSAEETIKVFGTNLYRHNIQPVWVEVENLNETTVLLLPMGVDTAYFTPLETFYRALLRRGNADSRELQRRSIERIFLPGRSTQSGYIFSRLDEGTKSFNVDVAGVDDTYRMTFFVPVPGLRLDHYRIDLDNLYTDAESYDVTLTELTEELERMPCCVTDASGERNGDPLNLVLIGNRKDLYYAFLRAGWDETETIYAASLWKTFTSAISGGRYRYSPISALYVFDRAQDVALQKARTSIHQRNHLRVWLTPMRYEGLPVWIGQISRDIGVRFTTKGITTHKIDPDVDETREYLIENLAYAESLSKFGYVRGVGAASYDQPRTNLTGDIYFTDGNRAVMWIPGQPTSLDQIEVVDL